MASTEDRAMQQDEAIVVAMLGALNEDIMQQDERATS